MSMQKSLLAVLIFLVCVAFMRFQCSKKDLPTSSVDSASSQSQEMPELDQNRLFETNRSGPARTPDYSFRQIDESAFEDAGKEAEDEEPID